MKLSFRTVVADRINNSKKNMKTFRISDFVGRLSSFLIAYGYPFTFDGKEIEFTESEDGKLFRNMDTIDPYLYKNPCLIHLN